MKKIAGNRNYKIVQAFKPGLAGGLGKWLTWDDENPCADLEEDLEQMKETIQGLKSFLRDKGFEPRDYTPSGGWSNYQPGAHEPNVSSQDHQRR
jgi:hypothetical protein